MIATSWTDNSAISFGWAFLKINFLFSKLTPSLKSESGGIITFFTNTSITELNEVLDMVSAIKTLKAKAGINVGDRVYVVQKTKKTPGTVRKINKSRAVVDMVVNPISGATAAYTVPFSMIQPVKEAA